MNAFIVLNDFIVYLFLQCCCTLAMLGFLDSTAALSDIHRTLLSVFSGSYSKGDGTPASVSVELATLHAAALSAWSLLLTIIDIHAFNDPYETILKFSNLFNLHLINIFLYN